MLVRASFTQFSHSKGDRLALLCDGAYAFKLVPSKELSDVHPFIAAVAQNLAPSSPKIDKPIQAPITPSKRQQEEPLLGAHTYVVCFVTM